MTAREQIQFRRLQLENEELRKANARHIQVFGAQALELIELRAQLEVLREVVNG